MPIDQLPEIVDESYVEVADTPVTDAMRGLPEKYRMTLHLFYFEDLPISDIAMMLDCSEGTIKSQLSRGRAMLRESLKEVSYV